MRKSVLITIGLLLACCMGVSAQNFAFIDMEYIMENLPEAQQAGEQIRQAQETYQREVEAALAEGKKLFDDYHAKLSTLTDEQKAQCESEILAKERAASELRNKYFGQDGELTKLEDKLMGPIEDAIYEAVKVLWQEEGYDVVVDRSSATGIIFADPRIDISDEVLRKLGISK